MSTPREHLIRLLEQGDAAALDRLTPEEMGAIEALLAEDAGFRSRLAGQRPVLDAWASRIAAPREAEWDRVWSRIQAASRPSGVHANARRLRLGWRIATPVLAAAACVMLLIGWPYAHGGGAQLARNVIIDDLETFGGASSAILTTGEDDAVAIIWVMDGDAGA